MNLFHTVWLLSLSIPVFAQSGEMIQRIEQNLHPNVVTNGKKVADIANRMQHFKVNGISLAVIEQGQIAWAKGYGVKDADNTSELVDTLTLFQCASIGKIITTVAALQLVSAHKIGLDEDINLKLKHWKVPENKYTDKKKVTLRLLLSHSAGLADDYGYQGYYPGSKLPTLIQILNAVSPANNKKKLSIANEPGTVERYSGGGFMIIQQLIEELSGMSFAAYASKFVFEPLGMKQTTYTYYPDAVTAVNMARGHEDNGKTDRQRKYNVYPESGAAGPWTTAIDLAKLLVAINQAASGRFSEVLNSEMASLMLSRQINSRGLGVPLKGDRAVSGFWHSGNNAGYTGIVFCITQTGQGAVVLTNSNAGESLIMEVIRSIADTYQWPVMRSINPLPIASLASYTGVYGLVGNKGALIVEANDGELYFYKRGSKQRYRMLNTSDNHFRIAEKPDNLSFEFQRDETGKIKTLIMYENTKDITRLDKLEHIDRP